MINRRNFLIGSAAVGASLCGTQALAQKIMGFKSGPILVATKIKRVAADDFEIDYMGNIRWSGPEIQEPKYTVQELYNWFQVKFDIPEQRTMTSSIEI